MDKEEKLKKAIAIAGAFAGWLIITVFIMIGIYQMMGVALQWNPYASGTFAFIAWMILLIAPTVMIFSYMSDD